MSLVSDLMGTSLAKDSKKAPMHHAKKGYVRKKGKKPITFEKGGLHRSLGVAQGEKIPAKAMQQALSGARGEKARKQAQFKKNVLTGPKRAAEGYPRHMQGGGTSYTPQQIIDMITRSATEHGIDEQYWWIPIAIAYGESGFNPNAVGDGGKSVGIYQLHENGAGSGMGNSRYDPQTNIDHQMGAFADVIKAKIRDAIHQEGPVDPEKLLQDVWRSVQHPSEDALNVGAPRAYRWAKTELFSGGAPNQFGGLTIGATPTTDTTDSGVNLDPTDPNSPLYDPTAAAQAKYYNAQADYLASQMGVDAGTLAEKIREFNAEWASNDQLKKSQASYYDALSQNLADQLGLDRDKLNESIRQFDLTLKQKQGEDVGTLTQNLLSERLADRRAAGQEQVDLFKTLQPNAVDTGGKVAGAIGRMLRGVNDGGAFPTADQNVRLSLTNPADMDAETKAAEDAARRILGLLQPTGMAVGGVVDGGMEQAMMPNQVTQMRGGAVDAAGRPLPAGTPNPDDPGLVADGQGNWVPAQEPQTSSDLMGLAESLMGGQSMGGQMMPKHAAGGEGDLQDMILTYLQGLDPTLKALTTGLSGVDVLGQLFGTLDPKVVDQLLAPLVPEGGTLGVGGQTEAAKEFEMNYSLALEKLGVDKTVADNQAKEIAARIQLGQLDADTRMGIAKIQDATNRIDIATRSGDTRYVADVQNEAQKYVADLNYKLGLGQLDVSRGELDVNRGRLNLERQQALAEAQANPRRLFETLALQAQQKPTDWASMLDTFVQPDFSAENIGAGTGLAPYLTGGNPQHMAEGTPSMEILVVGDHGNDGNVSRGTEEYVAAPKGTIVAPAQEGEHMTMENAVRAIVEQVLGEKHEAASGYPSQEKARMMLHEGTANGEPLSEKQRGLFGLLAGGGTPRHAAGGYGSAIEVSREAQNQLRLGNLAGAVGAALAAFNASRQAVGLPPVASAAYVPDSFFTGLGFRPQTVHQIRFAQQRGGGVLPTDSGIDLMTGQAIVSGPPETPQVPDETPREAPGDRNRTIGDALPERGMFTGNQGQGNTFGNVVSPYARTRVAMPRPPGFQTFQQRRYQRYRDRSAEPLPMAEGTPSGLDAVGTQVVGPALGKQFMGSSLFDALGGATTAFRDWSKRLFGNTGLPTYRQIQRLSPTQGGAYESYASESGVNPEDIITAVARDFAGFQPSRASGQLAGVSY